jgi:hypothetical protein
VNAIVRPILLAVGLTLAIILGLATTTAMDSHPAGHQPSTFDAATAGPGDIANPAWQGSAVDLLTAAVAR